MPYIMQTMAKISQFYNHKRSLILVLIGLLLIGLLTVWLLLTPKGFLGKLWAIAYAVCDQNPEHTLSLGGQLLPLCGRCTGMYLGAMIATAYLLRRGRASRFPSMGKNAVLALLALAFGMDGLNSGVALLWPAHVLYPPTNALRLFTGLGMGVVIVNLLLPLWNQTFWVEGTGAAVLNSWGQFAGLLVLETLAGILILTGKDWLYLPVAILSVGMVPVLLTGVYTLLGMVLFRHENLVKNWRAGAVYVACGLLAAFVQIGLFDWLRYALTASWAGFNI